MVSIKVKIMVISRGEQELTLEQRTRVNFYGMAGKVLFLYLNDVYKDFHLRITHETIHLFYAVF